MYNSLYINNIIFLYDIINNELYTAKLIKSDINKNESYIMNIYEMTSKLDKSIKITFYESKFVLTKIAKNDNNTFKLLYDMTSNNFNHLIDKGISLLPFNSRISKKYLFK